MPGERLQLLGGGCVDVEEVSLPGFLHGGKGRARNERDGYNESHDGKQKACADEHT